MINYDVKFLTCDESLHLKNSDFKSFKYETKKRVDETVYDSGKRSYCEKRGGLWRVAHPRQLRQLESKLRDRSIITCEWTTDHLITLVFSSGVIAYLTVKPNSLDVSQILFDRYFVGKLSGQSITNVALSKSYILVTHNDRTATLVTFGKNNVSLPCRITDRDPHIQNIELGGSSRRTERHLSSREGSNSARLLVWSVTVAEPAPWSPVLEDHANLHLYSINGHNISLTAYHQLENETLSAELSHKADNVVHIVEQVTCHKNGINLDWLRYEVNPDDHATKLSAGRDSATHVSLSTPVRVVRRAPCDTRLLIACIDGSLHVVHCVDGLTHTTRAGFIATEIRWADELIIAAEEGGRLQCFDRALSLLHHHSKCLDLTSYLRDSRRMQLLATRSAKAGPVILACFSGGPLTLLHITHPRLLTAWVRTKRSSNAISLLRAMDWEREGTQCLWAVNMLVCDALRSKAECLGWERVAQGAVGAGLCARAAAALAPPLHDLARKFFHHLLRRGRVEKALSLAVDLRACDLFRDAQCGAARRGHAQLAQEAAALAREHAQNNGSECSDSCSSCSSHSYTGSEEETSGTSELVKTKPPPLPRVSLPNHPTLMQVPITHTETVSTNSIRPNLHQYLERDNTIWTTDVRDDTYTRIENYDREYSKPIRSQGVRWHSMDVLSNYNGQKQKLLTINEAPARPTHTVVDIIPRPHDGLASTHFKHLYQTQLREEAPNTLYRYHNNNNYHPSTSLKTTYRIDSDAYEKQGSRSGERNKVKFSDTVTIAVVSEGRVSPEPARELAASLPLSPPHNYLAAFAPQAPPALPAAPAENLQQKPPKIKVVHFGMV
nr:WD repeat-containing and planar cell polarity effector protein fritz homolog [Helicoverpa armigera]